MASLAYNALHPQPFKDRGLKLALYEFMIFFHCIIVPYVT